MKTNIIYTTSMRCCYVNVPDAMRCWCMILSDASSLRIAYSSNPVLSIPDSKGSKAIKMMPETTTAAAASATSGVIASIYSPNTAAIRTAILRTVSANTWVYAEHYVYIYT